MFHDLRIGIRMLRRSSGFALLAVLCLTLGIASTTAVFSWVEGILLRPFPMVARQERMVAMTGTDRNGRTDTSWPDFQDLRRNCKLVEAFIAEHIGGATLTIGNRAESATGSVVSANYFDVLGIRPILGRTFEPSEDVGRNAHPVVVISYDAWQNRYHGDPAIIGRQQRLNGRYYTIIGVTPEGFYGTFVGYSFHFWVPASMEEAYAGGGYKLEDRGVRWIEGFAFLKPGVTLAQAQAELSAVAGRLEAAYPATNRGRGFQLYPLWQTPFNNAGALLPTLRISLVVACLVLLIACANVGNLLLVRSFERRHEMTVRLAVGAGRVRLIRQLLAEGLMLSIVSAGCGLLLANACRNAIRLLFRPMPAGIVVNLPARVDWRVLLVSAAVCLVATLLFGLVPAWQAGNVDLAGAMRAEGGGLVGARGRTRIRSALVLIQLSLSFTLLVGIGLLVKSLQAMRDIDPGFSTANVLVSGVDMIAAGYDLPRIREFQEQLAERLQGLAGVESAVWARGVPFSYRLPAAVPISVEGFVSDRGEQPTVEYNEVGPSYLATMGIPLLSGRDFTRADDQNAPLVAVVNQTMADRFWRGANPVGGRFQANGRWLQVVGMAKNVRYQSIRETPKPYFYTPLRQQSSPGQLIQIRTRFGPEAMAHTLTRQVQALDASLAPTETITMREQINRTNWSQSAAVTLLTTFGGIALLLAAVGLYGVMAYAVSQRARELGLRMALGADSGNLLRMVLRHGFALAAAGIAVGAAAAAGTTRLMGDLLYNVSPRDPAAFGVALVVMAVAVVAACLVPALRVMRTDPLRALRGD
ncbi:MAG TPA: ABC transporter permease [Bryobacteraceae bacterium]